MLNKEQNQEIKNQQSNNQAKNQKTVKPGDIKGKINVNDTRERKDGPGGN